MCNSICGCQPSAVDAWPSCKCLLRRKQFLNFLVSEHSNADTLTKSLITCCQSHYTGSHYSEIKSPTVLLWVKHVRLMKWDHMIIIIFYLFLGYALKVVRKNKWGLCDPSYWKGIGNIVHRFTAHYCKTQSTDVVELQTQWCNSLVCVIKCFFSSPSSMQIYNSD